MATSKNGQVDFEGGQSIVDFSQMTDAGDHKTHTLSGALIFSGKSGFEVDVRPNGIVTGRNLLSPHGSAETVTVAAFTAYSKGVLHEVDASSATVVRPTSNVAKIDSIIMTDAGAVDVQEGTEGTGTTFSDTRGVAGGPPEIPVDAVELGQVKMVSSTSAVIEASAIYQSIGVHTERFDFPTWKISNLGQGDKASIPAKKNAFIEFKTALSAIHTAGGYKRVYAKAYVPIMVEGDRSVDFKPVEVSFSTSSTQVYGETVGAVSSSIGTGGFKMLTKDNITDAFVGEAGEGEILTIRFYPDKNKAPYILTQGAIGIVRNFPVADQNQVEATISATSSSVNFSA